MISRLQYRYIPYALVFPAASRPSMRIRISLLPKSFPDDQHVIASGGSKASPPSHIQKHAATPT